MSTRKTKSRKQQRIEVKDEKANRKFVIITVAVTIILLILVYYTFSGF